MSARLYKMIREGEHQGQDFKFCINDSKKIARSLVAFANTDGGRFADWCKRQRENCGNQL